MDAKRQGRQDQFPRQNSEVRTVLIPLGFLSKRRQPNAIAPAMNALLLPPVIAIIFNIASSEALLAGVLGNNATDFPYLSRIPLTGFNCSGRSTGYYADDDPSSQCQVFHYCHHDGRVFNFLCPNNTIFNQKFFACDHYYNFDCSTAQEFYSLNEHLFENAIAEEDKP